MKEKGVRIWIQSEAKAHPMNRNGPACMALCGVLRVKFDGPIIKVGKQKAWQDKALG